jgi:hypothetical protein
MIVFIRFLNKKVIPFENKEGIAEREYIKGYLKVGLFNSFNLSTVILLFLVGFQLMVKRLSFPSRTFSIFRFEYGFVYRLKR